ncbi:enoyl-CoA hydratase/isomerase family protein [Castellaniella sp.]|uniref:enoyl-CoA hydratase/isomerase family protein n=1 Tax=Castellaniella sp. TaxID=1955812 RepID=UPI00355E8F91
MSQPAILQEIRGHVAILTVNRPEVHNALNAETMLAFERAFMDFEGNAQVRAIVITGAGEKSFIAGGDLAEMATREALPHYFEFAEDIHRIFRRVEACDKPTIAAVNGWALGGGTELLLCTDIRMLADNAVMALPEIGLGLFPGAGGTQRAIRQLAPCVARELMFTGERIDAHEAVRIGLANRVVPRGDLMKEALSLADRIAAKSPVVMKLLKRTLVEGGEMPLRSALAHEQAMISLVFDTKDAHEGMQAFLEKRSAKFSGN